VPTKRRIYAYEGDYQPVKEPLLVAIDMGEVRLALFIANPDLVRRIKKSQPLNAYDRFSFYGGGEHGYTEYKTPKEQSLTASI
jgi:hypothetical protein